jgi:rubredoxin
VSATNEKYIYENRSGYVVQVGRETIAWKRTLPEAIKVRDAFLHGDETGVRIAVLDIETTPILAYVWGLFDQNIAHGQIKEDWYILSVAWKWMGEDQGYVKGLCDYPGYVSGSDCEEQLVNLIHEILDEADFVVAHNGVRFDVKKINARFLEYGLPPSTPFKTIDTLRICRSAFGLTSNRLDFISKFLHGPGKIKHQGFDTWLGCMAGDPEMWELMLKYNLVDILELEKVYLAVRGWDKSHPNVTHNRNGGVLSCPTCGGTDLEELDRQAYATVLGYKAFKCRSCGQNVRSRKAEKGNPDLLVTVK